MYDTLKEERIFCRPLTNVSISGDHIRHEEDYPDHSDVPEVQPSMDTTNNNDANPLCKVPEPILECSAKTKEARVLNEAIKIIEQLDTNPIFREAFRMVVRRMRRRHQYYTPRQIFQSQSRRAAMYGKNDYDHGAWMKKVNRLNWICQYCGVKLTSKTLTQDHVIPVSNDGSWATRNLEPCCLSCNSRKHNKPLADFLNEQIIRHGLHPPIATRIKFKPDGKKSRSFLVLSLLGEIDQYV